MSLNFSLTVPNGFTSGCTHKPIWKFRIFLTGSVYDVLKIVPIDKIYLPVPVYSGSGARFMIYRRNGTAQLGTSEIQQINVFTNKLVSTATKKYNK